MMAEVAPRRNKMSLFSKFRKGLHSTDAYCAPATTMSWIVSHVLCVEGSLKSF